MYYVLEQNSQCLMIMVMHLHEDTFFFLTYYVLVVSTDKKSKKYLDMLVCNLYLWYDFGYSLSILLI